MRNATATAEAVVDVWSYAELIELPLGRVTELLDVTDVYRDAADWFDQVLIGTNVDNLLLVVIVDILRRTVHGHFFLIWQTCTAWPKPEDGSISALLN